MTVSPGRSRLPTVWTASWWTGVESGRGDVDALQLVPRAARGVRTVPQSGLSVTQLCSQLRCAVLIDLDDLQATRCAGPSPGRCWRPAAALAFEIGRVALERRYALNGNELLVPELAHALQLLVDELDLFLLCPQLAGQALRLVRKLGFALL
jgi:hypothetical protein